MRIEFRTVYDSFQNEKMGQLYAKHCIEKQIKQMNTMRNFIIGICILGFVLSSVVESLANLFIPIIIFPVFLIVGLVYIHWAKKKLYPKIFSDANGIGCPYNVTFGFYDEYFYEKFENNMSVQESSVRYEFLKKVTETPEYFILMTQRSSIFFLPKRDMNSDDVMVLSSFFRMRLPHKYSFAQN